MEPGGYAVVLVDARLGAERGTDLIDELRSSDPAAASRCLVITGGETRASPDGPRFLAKPFQPAELLAAVHALPAQPARPGAGPAAAGRPARPASAEGPGAAAAAGVPLAAASGAQLGQLLGITRRLRARERRELVDYLHDGPLQDLTAATLEAQLMRKSVPDGAAARFDVVLRQLDAAARALRWLVDGDLPLSQPEIELASALRRRTAWLLAVPLIVRSEEAVSRLSVADVAVIVDVVELLLLGMLPAGRAAEASVAVRAEQQLTQLELTLVPAAQDGQPVGDPVAAQQALDELAVALGTAAQAEFCAERWRARITLPS
jgi:hypothetical protein